MCKVELSVVRRGVGTLKLGVGFDGGLWSLLDVWGCEGKLVQETK